MSNKSRLLSALETARYFMVVQVGEKDKTIEALDEIKQILEEMGK